MEAGRRITTFKEFWPSYVRAHRRRSTQALHLVGSFAALAWAIVCINEGLWRFLPIALVLGYGPAWIGHYFFEGNRPATFSYARFSFIADWVMIFFILTGKMPEQIKRHCGEQGTLP